MVTPALPGDLARLAAVVTLHLLPLHRQHVGCVPLAHTLQRYLDLLRLPPVITHLALFYLHRAVSSPAFSASSYSITRLFVMAYSLADTYLDDNAYSNKSWCQVLSDGIHIREWNRIQAEMWVRGLAYSLEINDIEWKNWCSWISGWWRERGTFEWQRQWNLHRLPMAIPANGMLPSPLEDDECATSYFPDVSLPSRVTQRRAPSSSASMVTAVAALDSVTNDITALYVSASDSDTEDEESDQEECEDHVTVLHARRPSAPVFSTQASRPAQHRIRAASHSHTASLALAHTRQPSDVSPSISSVLARSAYSQRLKSSASVEFRKNPASSPYRASPGGAHRQRKSSVGRVMADACEQWWEQTVLRRMSSIRSIGSATSAATAVSMSRRSSANWSPATVFAASPSPLAYSTASNDKSVHGMIKSRKDSALGGMRDGESVEPQRPEGIDASVAC